jgi:16S rRNA (guanine527-N7)-methyltransferase
VTDVGDATKRELPTDPGSLASMGPVFDEALEAGLAELGLADGPAGSAAARRSYEAHARLLREWNGAINLTAIREPADVATRHVVDSLSAVEALAGLARPGSSLLDIGSGAGYPGLPLAAALPLGRVGLLDSVSKKARFLETAGNAVATILAEGPDPAPSIEAINERAEDLAEEPDHRAAWDIVTTRAVGSLADVIELSMPLTREGGTVVAWKHEDGRDGLHTELRRAGSIIRATGGGRPTIISVPAASLADHRLVVISKERPTPAGYPRPVSTRKRRKR